MPEASLRYGTGKILPVDTICAVVVTFHPATQQLRQLLESIAKQVKSIVVIDNTPYPGASDLEALLAVAHPAATHIIRFGENRGISAAQNAGISWALAGGTGYVLLLDQDSLLEPGTVEKLRETAKQLLTNNTRVAAVGPCYINPTSNRMAFVEQIGTWRVRKVSCENHPAGAVIHSDIIISSGSLIPASTIEAVGVLDEPLFVDGVDHEWCLRARDRGYTCHVVCGARMHHHLGTGIKRYWLGRWRLLPVHTPIRHYYMLRNILLLCRRSYVPLPWALRHSARIATQIISSLLILPERLNRLRMVFRAAWHGVLGRGGHYE